MANEAPEHPRILPVSLSEILFVPQCLSESRLSQSFFLTARKMLINIDDSSVGIIIFVFLLLFMEL